LRIFFQKSVQETETLLKSDVKSGTAHEDSRKCMIICRRFPLRMRNVPDSRGHRNVPDRRGHRNVPDSRGHRNVPDSRGHKNSKQTFCD
jgi:hypothetical protein